MAARDAQALLRKVFPPMLATLTGAIPKDEQNWIFELKYDGFRAVAALVDGDAAMWSRNAIDLAPRFPQIFAALDKVKVGEAVVDGEIVALDEEGAPRFQLLQRGEKARTFFFVFDLLWLDGTDLRQRPLEERRRLLEKLLTSRRRDGSIIRLAERKTEPAKKALQEAARRGYEGLIAKRRSSRYENRRSREWLKIKAVNAQEFAIVGFTPATNTPREIGSLMLGVVEKGNMRYAGRVGTGFSTKQRMDLMRELSKDAVPKPPIVNSPRTKGATWVEPKYVAQVRFTEWTADGSLRHPSFLGLRPDKSPFECVVERPAPPPPPNPETRRRGDAGKGRRGDAEKGRRGDAETRRRGEKPAVSPRPRVPVSPRLRVRAVGVDRVPASPRSGGRVEVKFTSPDRVLYPRDGITKRDVADYYQAMAEPIMRALAGRPLALEHWNDGIDRGSWFQQNIGKEAPPWMTLVETPTRTSKRAVRHLVVDRPETLRWLAQHSVLTIHMWSSRAESLESPDWLVFDLDPAKGKGIEQAVEAALVLRKLLDQLRVPSVPKTSGKRGIHVFVPLIPGYTHEDAVEWSCRLADAISDKVSFVTVERSLSKRRGRLYFDCRQNGYGKTVVAPYSLRAIDGAPVSAPLQWSEVNAKLDPRKFNLRIMPDRLAKYGDLFRPVVEGGIHLPRLR